MRRKISVSELKFGMYIDELDRPWLETPFLFQGFPLYEEEELLQLQQYCEFVYVYDNADEVAKHISQSRHHLPPADLSPPPPPPQFPTAKINIKPEPKPKGQFPKQDHHHFLNELRTIKKTYNQTHRYIIQVLKDVRIGNNIDVDSAKSIAADITDSILQNENALVLLSQLKQHDEYTIRHSINVCILALLFAKYIGLEKGQLRDLGVGALLHDIGKMSLPKSILNKPGPLTESEFKKVQQHPECGYLILEHYHALPTAALEAVRSHHERIDGSGYPHGLLEKQISLFPLIVSIVDVYDAITTNRSYHSGISPHEALKLMYENEMGAYPKTLMDTFIQCLSIFPIGSIVQLDNDEIGIVVTVNRNKHLFPIVLLVLDAKRRPYYPRLLCNLETMNELGTPIKIKRILESNAFGIDVTRILFEEGDFDAMAIYHDNLPAEPAPGPLS